MYIKREGVKQNIEEGIRLIRLAVEAGDAKAKFVLGNILINGDGVKPNIEEGAKLIRESAKDKYKKAIKYLKENPNLLNYKQN